MSVYTRTFLDHTMILVILLINFNEMYIYPTWLKYQKYVFFPIFFVNFEKNRKFFSNKVNQIVFIED